MQHLFLSMRYSDFIFLIIFLLNVCVIVVKFLYAHYTLTDLLFLDVTYIQIYNVGTDICAKPSSVNRLNTFTNLRKRISKHLLRFKLTVCAVFLILYIFSVTFLLNTNIFFFFPQKMQSLYICF